MARRGFGIIFTLLGVAFVVSSPCGNGCNASRIQNARPSVLATGSPTVLT